MKIYKEFEKVGKILFQQGLVSATAGNLSIRKNDKLYITASGSFLGELKWNDVVEFPLSDSKIYDQQSLFSKDPSMELVVHKSIYENTAHNAVAHAHLPTTLAISFGIDKIVPCDSEGRYYMPEIPVISVNSGISSSEVAKAVPPLLNRYPAVVIKKHGVFAASDTLIGACSMLSTLEFSSNILYKKKIFENSGH